MFPNGAAQSRVIALSGSESSIVRLVALAFRGARFALGLGDLDLRLVSGFVLPRGDPSALPLLLLMALSYPVVGGVLGWFVPWKP